ncbi:MAG: methyltransferase domain-containing protein [Pararhodobacter sp.]
MSATLDSDWNPGAYDRFRGLRLRPAADLLAQVPDDLPPGAVVDLGCGSGAAGPLLRARFPDHPLLGIDMSPAMLARASETGCYHHLAEADIATWRPDAPPALIFSNAALHWLGDHATLMPHLAGLLAPGGVLAVQMPGNFLAPSHALLRAVAAQLFAGRFEAEPYVPPVSTARDYLALLAPLGQAEGWETEYVQRLAPLADGAHPVRAFTASTAMRPFLAALSATEARAFTRAYEAGLDLAYPRAEDGAVLFPFRRVFFLLQIP